MVVSLCAELISNLASRSDYQVAEVIRNLYPRAYKCTPVLLWYHSPPTTKQVLHPLSSAVQSCCCNNFTRILHFQMSVKKARRKPTGIYSLFFPQCFTKSHMSYALFAWCARNYYMHTSCFHVHKETFKE